MWTDRKEPASPIQKDSLCNLWVATMNGICLYDRGSDSFRTLSNNGKPIYVASYLLVEGGILLGGSGAIYKYVYATNKLEPLYYAQDPVYYNPFWQMIRYDEENILLNSRWHGIYSLSSKAASGTLPEWEHICFQIVSQHPLVPGRYPL